MPLFPEPGPDPRLNGRWVGVVGCSRKKLGRSAPAHRFYTSSLFRETTKWCYKNVSRYMVLSARYGLVEPDLVLKPYDFILDNHDYPTVADMPKANQDEWIAWVRSQWEMKIGNSPVMCFLTKPYYRRVQTPKTLSFWGTSYGFPQCGEISKRNLLRRTPVLTRDVLAEIRGRN